MTMKRVGVVAVAAVGCLALTVLPDTALAQTTSGLDLTSVLQNIVSMLTGTAAKLLATLAIILTGVAWMFGFMDLRRVGYTVLGIGLLFGASQMVSLITGGGGQ